MITVMILSPLGNIRLEQMESVLQQKERSGQLQTNRGQTIAAESQKEIIARKVAAYILDKAQALETELDVKVTVADGEIPVPESVRLTGMISPYARAQLQKIIAQDLGIPKEHQIWIG